MKKSLSICLPFVSLLSIMSLTQAFFLYLRIVVLIQEDWVIQAFLKYMLLKSTVLESQCALRGITAWESFLCSLFGITLPVLAGLCRIVGAHCKKAKSSIYEQDKPNKNRQPDSNNPEKSFDFVLPGLYCA